MFNILTIAMCLTVGSLSLSLDGVSIPSSHPAGQDLTLDCDYSYLEPESEQLVLTWYFNGSPIPIYQWVPALDLGPQVIHQMFKDNLEITYEADADKLKKHRALHIINPDQRFSGNYKCRVSTFLEEVSDKKDVFIYVPPASITLTNTEGAVSCHVEAVYPTPTVVMTWTANSTVYTSDQVELTSNNLNPELFDAYVAASMEEADIAPHDMMTCEVTMAGTDFDKRVENNILKKIEPATEVELEVELVDNLCNSSDCSPSMKDAAVDSYPVDYEAVDKTLEIGTGHDTFSEEAATFIESSSSSVGFNILLVGLISAVALHYSL